MTQNPEFTKLIAEAYAQPFVGWDFSWLGSRMVTTPLPWDYDAIVQRRARASPDMLDIGTGGGEWLAALRHRPPRTVATEAWEPNVDVAGARLRPLGVTVVCDEGAPDNAKQAPEETRGRLPFPGKSFELVVNRHEAFVAKEIARILTPGGRFATQQVGSASADFHRLLGLRLLSELSEPAWTLSLAIAQIEGAGLRVIASDEGIQVLSFADVGAVAWYLKAVPWTVPGFSMRTHRARLGALHRRITDDGPVSVELPAFWLEAVEPEQPRADAV